jgi:hypothetical protein
MERPKDLDDLYLGAKCMEKLADLYVLCVGRLADQKGRDHMK